MRKLGSYSFVWIICISFAVLFLTGSNAGKEKELRPGERYEVIGPLYAYGIAHDLRTRAVSIVALESLQLSGPEIVSRQVVPLGSTLTIVEAAERKLFSFLYPPRYIVRISGVEVPAEVPVVIDLSRGVEGSTTPLNTKIFKAL